MKSLAVALSILLSYADLLVAIPCIVRATQAVKGVNMTLTTVSVQRRRIMVIGQFFIALHFFRTALDRTYAAWSFHSGLWPPNNATITWFTSNAVASLAAIMVLWWGVQMSQTDTDQGRERGDAIFLSLMLLGIFLSICAFMVDFLYPAALK
jgi:hypothetical protein